MADLSFLEDFTKGDRAKIERYIRLFLEVAPTTFQAMEQDTKQGAWAQLRINAHSLKPQAEFMGLPDLKSVLVLIEDQAEQQDIPHLVALVGEAKELFEDAKPLLEAYLSQA